MPFTKAQNRYIYITALVLAFLLIAGSIYLHIRQKHHLGRLSFDLDRDHVNPTNGVEKITQKEELMYASVEDEIDDNYKIEQFDKTVLDEANKTTISHDCLHCLCMTVNNCQTTYCSPGEPCGLYRISKLYWIDGDKPILGISDYYDNVEIEEVNEYRTCINNKFCAIDTIRNYIKRYERDCNKDGIIDCRDHIALHLLGPNGCMTQNMSLTHASRMKNCLG